MVICGLITARGGSKGIPGKNIKQFCGRPLICWTIDAARKSRLSRIFLSTDDPVIAALGEAEGIEVPFLRPAELAGDMSTSLDVVIHFLDFLHKQEGNIPDALCLLQPTSPLRRAEHIDRAISMLETNPDATSVISVVKACHSMIPESIMRMDSGGFLNPYIPRAADGQSRQNKPIYYARNGAAVYLTRIPIIRETKSLYGDRILPLIMAREESVDIDDSFDWKIAEYLLSERLRNQSE